MNPRVFELESLRTDALSCVERVADTLLWFSEQFKVRGTLPRNIWRELDRPLPRETVALGGAFDLWHSMLRAEGALSNAKPRLAQNLAIEAHNIRDRLRKLLDNPTP